jgi:hypothetical protein
MKTRLWSNFFSVFHYSAHSPLESWCASPCRDPTHNIASLPPNPHQRMGKLLVGLCLSTIAPPALAISQGSRRTIATRQCLPLIATAFSPRRRHLPTHRRLTSLSHIYCHLTAVILFSTRWLSTPTCRCACFALTPSPVSPPLSSLQLFFRVAKMNFRYFMLF